MWQRPEARALVRPAQANQITDPVARTIRGPLRALLISGGAAQLSYDAAKRNGSIGDRGDALIPEVAGPTHKGFTVPSITNPAACIG